MKRKQRTRPLNRTFEDSWSRAETMAVLADALTAPSREMDVPLVRECLVTLDPSLGEGLDPRGEALWRRIQASIAYRGWRHMPRRRFAMIVLAVVLALALAAVAVGAAMQRGVFNFLYDFGFDRSGAQVQEAAQTLLRSNLASLSLAHVDLEVREAVYDGHDLRIVYSVTERGRSADNPFTEEDVYKPVIDAGWDDGLTCCDWLEVNGQDVYFNDTFQAVGEKPGEMLYYLQTNLPAWGVTDVGDTMTIGLPMMRSEEGPGYIPDALRFTIDATIPEGMVRKAAPVRVTIGKVPFSLEEAEFSPVSGIVRIALHGDQAALYKLGNMWGYAQVYDATDGAAVGITSLNHWGYQDKDRIEIEFTVSAPAAWPQEMVIALPDREGLADIDCRIPITLQ